MDIFKIVAIAQRVYNEEVAFQSRQKGIFAAPHFLFWLATQQSTPSPNHQNPIRTTIDQPLQQFVEAQLQQVLSSSLRITFTTQLL